MQEEATEQEFYAWFYHNSDFGPAHSDVMISMFEEFEEETGKLIPDEMKEGY